MKIHFVSGLPRSGSTLLVALLKQNPAFESGVALATLRVLQAIESATSRESETSLLLTEDQKWNLRRAVFSAIYGNTVKTVFDKNHLWCAKMPLIAALFPEAKVIACVRDIGWIMDSFERLFQRNPLELSAMFGFKPATTVYTRVGRMAASDGVVGMSLDALREAYYGPWRDRLHLVEYNHLVLAPIVTMHRIYEFIGEPFFEHDFDNVGFSSPEFDAAVGMPGLHTVKPQVRHVPRETLLPPDLFERFKNDAFWFKQRPHSVREVA